MTFQFSIPVELPTDERGLIGRRCPSCGDYFKLRPGTGLPTERCHCAYCGTEADASDFLTPEQSDYIRSVGIREAQQRVIDPSLRKWGRDFERYMRGHARGPIGIQVKVERSLRSIPLTMYREREVETPVTCENCGLEFAVFGVFASCPDCNSLNAHSVFRQSLVAARKRLLLHEDANDEELREALLSDVLGSAVGAFDAVGKELQRRLTGVLHGKTANLFQNLEVLNEELRRSRGRSLRDELGDDDYDDLFRMFQVRHIYEHNMGVVDDRFVKKVPGGRALRGRRYPLKREAVERFLDLLGTAYEATVRILEGAGAP